MRERRGPAIVNARQDTHGSKHASRHKTKRLGLRWRVALAFTVAFTLMMCALGFALFTAFEEMEDTLVERLQNDEVNFIVERLRDNPQLSPSTNPHLKAYLVRTPAEQAALPAYLRPLGVGQHEIFEQDNQFHITVREVSGARLYVAYDVSPFQQRERQFMVFLGLSILAVIGLSLTLGYWLSGVLVKQITMLAETVETLTPGAARPPLAQPGQDAEVAQLARAFDHYQARLEALLRREQEFTANASHELRTPLASLLGFVETLQGPARDDPAAHAQFLPIMADQARRMSRLIDDLLSLSRIEQTQHVRPSARVDMADILRRAMDELSPLAQEERAVVTINAPQNAWVVGDPDELIRVVENLIENAIKYGAKPGGSAHVTIDLALGDHDVELSVQDEGPGIEPEHLPRLTERFYRADAKSSRAKGGTGLGLAIVKHIVVRHSGRLVIESEPGLGTKFAVRIPKNKSGA